MKHKYSIVGVGESDRSRESGKSTLRLAVEAGRRAIADAGIDPKDIDGIMSYQEMDSSEAHSVAALLGIQPSYFMDALGGGSSTENLVATAIGLIEAGYLKAVMIYRAMNGRSGARMGGGVAADASWNLSALWMRVFHATSFTTPYGLVTPADQFGLVARRHMRDRGLTEEHLGQVCVSFYGNAQTNPKAIYYGKPLSLDTYMAAKYITEPFRLFDYSTETDEGNAIIVARADVAANCSSRPVTIASVSTREAVPLAHHYSMPDITEFGSSIAAEKVYGRAGLGPADIDVAAIYDCFSWVALAQIEAFRLVPGGDIGGFVADGNLSIGGALPTNTAGGMLSEGYTHGMNNLIELVRQIRHEYDGTPRQVEGCEVGLCTGWGGPRSSTALILTR